MPANDFQNAIITITYTSAEVAGINPSYTIYTYNASSNSYTALNSVVDNSAKTITVTLKSITNPLLAIGGATAPVPPSGFPPWIWVLVASAILVIVLIAVLILRRRE
jgi:hypothetical protein